MLNNLSLVGRVVKDLKLNQTGNGKPVTNMTLACKRIGAKPDESGKMPSDFPTVVIWGELAKNSCKYLAQGDLAGVTGRIQTRTYQDADGKTQFVTEIVAEQVQFLGKSKKNLEASTANSNEHQANSHFQQQETNNNNSWGGWGDSSNNDDDYPF